MVASLGDSSLRAQQPLLCLNRVVQQDLGEKISATSGGRVRRTRTPPESCSVAKFLESYAAVYQGRVLVKTVPFVQIPVGDLRRNPNPKIFVRSKDGKRWINKNPDPKRYVQGDDGNFHARAGQTKASSGETTTEKTPAKKVSDKDSTGKSKSPLFLSDNPVEIRDAAWRAGEVVDAVRELSRPAKGLTKVLKGLGSTAGQVAGGARIIDGVQNLEEGFREAGSGIRKKLTGLKDILFGLAAVAVPGLQPLALILTNFLLGWDLKDAAKERHMRDEMSALGWMGACVGWLIPLVGKKSLGHLAGAVGGAGSGLIALKDLNEFVIAYRAKDLGKQFCAAGNTVAHIGMALTFLLPASMWVGVTLLAVGLVPTLLHELMPKFAKKAEKAMARFNEKLIDPVAPGLVKGARPFVAPLNWLRDKVVKPAERFMGKWLVEKPLRAIGKPFKPLYDWFQKKIDPALDYVILHYVFGTINKVFVVLQKRLAKLAKTGAAVGKVVAAEVVEKAAVKAENPAY